MGSEASVGRTAIDAAMAEQVDLDADRKKEILSLERALDRLNHFEVLGLRPGASAGEVKKAYHEASRRYHPDRFFEKNLGSFRARVERIFKRIHDSYSVLSDVDLRAQYERDHPDIASPPAAVSLTKDEARAAERRARLARHPYVAKLTRVHELLDSGRKNLASGDFSKAYTDLHLASKLDPKNQDVHELIHQVRHRHELQRAAEELKRGEAAERVKDLVAAARCYLNAADLDPKSSLAAAKAAKLLLHPGNDLKQARALAQRAVDLDPDNADHRFLLAAILDQAGMSKLASRQVEEAIKLNPNHPEAKKRQKKPRWPF
ncbi:MAG TPA: DnaJ domain-containing protein [Myxococcaceae bacterium]|nr:DnaJ domain-containing protein [Myxococcaceae bacterium]